MAAGKRTADYVPSIGDEAVRAKTARTWAEWFTLLDRAKAHEWTHAEIARWLGGEQKLASWWRQMVTVEYERARGMRQVHEQSDGFAATASKTVAVDVAEMYAWWAEPDRRRKWMGAVKLQAGGMTPEKSMRLKLGDGSAVMIGFYTKGESKSQVTVDHRKLADAAAVARWKAFWREKLEKLATLAAR